MYAIHTTPGFIVSSRHTGEAGKLLSIFTKDLGLIRATAQGIRFEKSKLRPFIQDYSLGVFSFVRGKEYWRLTNAQELVGGNMGILNRGIKGGGGDSQELIARIALLLSRLLQGEEAHPELFETLNSLFIFLQTNVDLTYDDVKTLESLVVVRILHRLGYVSAVTEFKGRVEINEISTEILTDLKESRISMNQHINKALRESHL